MVPCTPAQAYWNQRQALADCRERILSLSQAVDRPSDLYSFHWAQLMAFALEFAPDLILELGRGCGNSTCAFTEAAHRLGKGRCRVLSLCDCDLWDVRTLPRLRRVVPEEWFDPLSARRGDILAFDFETALANARRVLIFWDAHGFEVAECVLGNILPLVAARPHAVIMHDMSDTRYCAPPRSYDHAGLWKGESSDGPPFMLGHIATHVAQAVSILDFAGRNGVTLESADHSYHEELVGDPKKFAEMERLLGPELFSTSAHWFWFSLNAVKGPYQFPHFDPGVKSPESQAQGLRLQLEAFRKHHEQQVGSLLYELEVTRNRLQQLTRSRWRKLGQRLGFTRQASWESNTSNAN